MKYREPLQCLGLVVLVLMGSSLAYCQETSQSKGEEPRRAASPLPDDPADWGNLTDEQVDEITLRNLRRIMWAVHLNADAHNGQFPPGAVPNESVAPYKRLSGFVLLLPYLGVRPSYLAEDDETWVKWKADSRAAKKAAATIDLKKAWDDPANAQAARTIVSSFVAPGGAPMRDAKGFAVSHFAFVRGSAGKGDGGFENGAFPLTRKGTTVTFADIKDGTSNTLALGQIHEQLGPWTAAGAPTARHAYHPSVEHKKPRFGSRHEGAAYFANCDGFAYFFDMASVDVDALRFLAGRFDREITSDAERHRYSSATDWKEAKRTVK